VLVGEHAAVADAEDTVVDEHLVADLSLGRNVLGLGDRVAVAIHLLSQRGDLFVARSGALLKGGGGLLLIVLHERVLHGLVGPFGLALADHLDGDQPRPLDLGAGAGVLQLDLRVVGGHDGVGNHLRLGAARALAFLGLRLGLLLGRGIAKSTRVDRHVSLLPTALCRLVRAVWRAALVGAVVPDPRSLQLFTRPVPPSVLVALEL
jgi:hypothetical protein